MANKRSKPKQNGSAKSLWINRTQIFAFLVTLPFLSVKYTLSHEEKLSGFNWNYLLCKHKIYYQSLLKKKDFWKRASLAGWALLRYCVSLCVSQDLWVLNYWMWIVANARLGKIMVFNWHIPLPSNGDHTRNIWLRIIFQLKKAFSDIKIYRSYRNWFFLL